MLLNLIFYLHTNPKINIFMFMLFFCSALAESYPEELHPDMSRPEDRTTYSWPSKLHSIIIHKIPIYAT